MPNNLMPYISQTAIGRLECLNVFGDDYDTPDGTGVRDYIHVMDLARGHVSAIAYMAAHTGESIFNLGTGRGYSVLEMVHAFEAANHVHVPYRIAPRRAGDLPTVYACPDNALRLAPAIRKSLAPPAGGAFLRPEAGPVVCVLHKQNKNMC